MTLVFLNVLKLFCFISENTAYIFSEGDNIDTLIGVEMCNLDEDPAESCSETELLWVDTETDAIYNSLSGCFLLADLKIVDDSVNKYGERWL